jgi:hypothetical protein
MSLEQNHKKIKSLIQFLIIILSISISYKYSVIYRFYNSRGLIEVQKNHFTVDFSGQVSNPSDNNDNVSVTFYIAASKNGTKYYYEGCSGLNRINSENLVYFDSEPSAEEKGYELAKNCENMKK